MVRQPTGQLEPLQRDKILISIYDSCKHRPSAYDDATALTKTCLGDIIQAGSDGVIERNAIVALVGSVLERFDGAAATMFRAYHPLKAG